MLSENPIPENNPTPDTSGEADDQPSQPQPNIMPAVCRSQFPPTHAHYEITCKHEKNWWDKWKPLVEIIGIVLLAIYTGYTIKMYRANRDAANAAKDAAKTSGDTFSFTQRQFRMEQRPYLSPTPRGAFEIVRNGQKTTSAVAVIDGVYHVLVAVDIQNQGRSPAIDTKHTNTGYIVGPLEKATDAAMKYRPDYSNAAPSVITMNNTVTPISKEVTLSKDQYQMLREGTLAFYIVGGVQYRDMFSPPIEPYESTYCYRLHPDGMPFANCGFKIGSFETSIK